MDVLLDEMKMDWEVLNSNVMKECFFDTPLTTKLKCYNKQLGRIVESANMKIDEKMQHVENSIENHEEEFE